MTLSNLKCPGPELRRFREMPEEALKSFENPVLNHEDACPGPKIETNLQSRHQNNLKSQELQAEQFIACTTPNKPKIVYGNRSANGNESVREATMSLYDSLNASDHI